MSTPINAIITTVCLNIFSCTASCYFSEIKLKVEREAGPPIGDGFLAAAIEGLGYTVDDSFQPWVVRA